MTTVTCQHCGLVFQTQRRTRKFCSQTCSNRATWKVTKTRECRHCGQSFEVSGAGDANRQHCSKQCAKNHNAKQVKDWLTEHPEAMDGYRANQIAKNPGIWRAKYQSERERIIALLGGACVVCGVTNRYWLHVDFIPTTRQAKYRHPRHYAWVSKHKDLFRVLCANHHYELTLTGKIEGTDITQ